MTLDRHQIELLLPHRPPILIVDHVIDVIPKERGTGRKEFTSDDSWFQGHFPDSPVLPGVMVIEAFAQTAMAVLLAEQGGDRESARKGSGLLGKVNDMAFIQRILPGDRVDFHIKVERRIGSFAFVQCEASKDAVKLAHGSITLKIGD